MDYIKTALNGIKQYVQGVQKKLERDTDRKIKDNTPDWNQNDPDGKGYIQNRPFYTEKAGDIVTYLSGTYSNWLKIVGKASTDPGGKTLSFALRQQVYKNIKPIYTGNGEVWKYYVSDDSKDGIWVSMTSKSVGVFNEKYEGEPFVFIVTTHKDEVVYKIPDKYYDHGMFVINITYDSTNETYSADKTYAEIVSARDKGLFPVCKMEQGVVSNYVYGYCYYIGELQYHRDTNRLYFRNIELERENYSHYVSVGISENNYVSVGSESLTMSYDKDSGRVTTGYVPSSSNLTLNYFLRGDATWKPVLQPPSTASIGQYLSVKSVDDNGIVTETEAVDAPTSLGLTGVSPNQILVVDTVDDYGEPLTWRARTTQFPIILKTNEDGTISASQSVDDIANTKYSTGIGCDVFIVDAADNIIAPLSRTKVIDNHPNVYFDYYDSDGSLIEIRGCPSGDSSSGDIWTKTVISSRPIDALYLNSSTTDSTKKFKITVDDSGTLTVTEVTET